MGMFDDLIPQQQPVQQSVQPGGGTGGLFDDLIPKQQQPAQGTPVTMGGLAKAAAAGLGRGLAGIAGIPGDLTSLATGGAHGQGWGSQAIQSGVENNITGQWHQPQNTAERYAQTIGEFAPAAALPAGELGIGARLLRMAALPGAASEAAGEATQGTPYEPYARMGAGLLAGGLGAPRASMPKLQGADELAEAANVGAYKNPAIMQQPFTRSAVNDMKSQMRASQGSLADPQLGMTTSKLINGMGGQGLNALKFETLQNTRTLLSQLAGKFGDPLEQAAAGKAKDAFDSFIGNLQDSHLLGAQPGAADEFKTAFSTAKQNLLASKTLDLIAGKTYAADLDAAAANSGVNFENAMRKRIKGIMVSPKQLGRFTALDSANPGLGLVDAMDAVVRGGPIDNVTRIIGNLLGGGLGAYGLGVGALGHMVGGPLGAVAAPATGYAMKQLGNMKIKNKVNAINNAIMASAPANKQILANQAKIGAANRNATIRQGLISAALAPQGATPQGASLPMLPQPQ
jgi:hypothetical protein